jgi:transitional endoplasmic reticulum ATPase
MSNEQIRKKNEPKVQVDGIVELRVAEALQKDVGRGIARIDPGDMAKMGVKPGDIIGITGKKESVAKVMPSFPEDRGKNNVQIDGLVRDNVDANLGEKLHLQRIKWKLAIKLELLPIGSPRAVASGLHNRHVGRLLEGLALVEGDRVRTTSIGSRSRDFIVSRVVPKGAVVIHSSTEIEISRKASDAISGQRIAYEDIGGLKRELGSIREMIELPLRYPELFEQLGIDAPKGVLMYGPPGCGKTLIARAVANETDAKFFTLSGPEIMHKHYGESEAHLRKVFEEASRSPSIIFFDEIDAIAPKRSDLSGGQQVERRVVSQLLTLMDGLDSRGQVIVIGATNMPDSIDPALRRPGRFDREIVIGVPDRPGRLEILSIHTRGMPLADNVDLDHLAQITHGFVGADLQSLAREAAMARLRQVFLNGNFDLDQVPEDLLEGLTIGMDAFKQALAVVEPSAIRELFTEIPDVKWSDVGGLNDVKQLLDETIQWPMRHQVLFKKAGITPPKGILLCGPPGVGKTMLAKALATESEINFISVKGPALMSKWVGETERAVRDIFHKAKLASPCIIFLDEIDSIAPRRGGGEASAVTDRVIAQLLTEMDGIEELNGVLVLAATNRKDLVDPALLRAGRFDFVVELPLPDAKARKQIFGVHTQDKPLADDVQIDILAGESSNGWNGADIEFACRRAGTLAIRDYLALHPSPPPGLDTFRILQKHFDEAVQAVKQKE